MKKNDKKKPKRQYKKPAIKSEEVSIASLAKACNGMEAGNSGRKAAAPCTVLLS